MDLSPPPPRTEPRAPEPPRTGAFADVRLRWLPLWALVGLLIVSGLLAAAGRVVDIADPAEVEAILMYGVILAWIVLMVARRGRVHLAAMLTWPRLGAYWFVVAGLLVVQFVFSLAAILVTQLVAPSLGEALEGVGEGNLLLAVLGLAVLPPLVEEVLFRGVFVERFAVKWRVGTAVVVSAVFFGVLHVDPVGAGVFGVITGLLYLRTGSLWPGIIIHAVNNAVALAAIRLADAELAAPPPEVGQTLVAAGVLLAVSLPFLVWFILATWPARGSPTPYQRFELSHGLPSRTIRGVRWSAWGRPLDLMVSGTHATLADPAGVTVAALPLVRIQAIYAAPAVAGDDVVVLLADGTWTTLQAPSATPRATRTLVGTLAERAGSAVVPSAPRPGAGAETPAVPP